MAWSGMSMLPKEFWGIACATLRGLSGQKGLMNWVCAGCGTQEYPANHENGAGPPTSA